MTSTIRGSWQTIGKLNVSLLGTKFFRRSNLNGLTSTTQPANTSLEEYLQEFSSTGRDVLSKFGFVVVTHLSDMFNFTLKFGKVPPRKAGDKLNTIIRALDNNDMDLSGSPTVMNVQRTYLVQFIHQSWPFRTCFIF
ncbi:uncharacterized protein LOC107980519 [Nasonia vitripennis]|uniref:Uncharacterized protein n=1 Tax=Nasonia vitripennis TaxID=7425 RepID=A0A7M7T6K2_NASVI|nr:uncharacterized protein LOC107980519 [Nasonia vitripennis]